MKKLLTVTLVMVFVLGLMSGVAGATSTNMDEGFENSPAFEEYGTNWYGHVEGTPRFGTATGNIAIGATEAGENADDESIVAERDDYSLVQTGTVGE